MRRPLCEWLMGRRKPALKPDYPAALASMVDRPRLSEAGYRKRSPFPFQEQTDPRITLFALHFVREAAEYGVPLVVTEGWRSDERQAALLREGVTRAGPGQSAHSRGLAVDVVHYPRFWDLTREEWEVLGVMGKEVARRLELKVTWGGDWTSIWDPAHWELAGWRDL